VLKCQYMQGGGQSANQVKRYVSRLSTLFYGLMYCVLVLETGEIKLEKRWLCSAKVCSVWVHRTVRCARLARANWPLSGNRRRRTAKIHRTVRCAPDYPVSQRSARPTVGRVICAGHVAEPTARRGHRTVRCTNGSQAPMVGFTI
jgi:hypothetical protein